MLARHFRSAGILSRAVIVVAIMARTQLTLVLPAGQCLERHVCAAILLAAIPQEVMSYHTVHVMQRLN